MFRVRIFTHLLNNKCKGPNLSCSVSSLGEKQEFTRLELIRKDAPKRRWMVKGQVKTELSQPRYKQMPVDQKWSDVWPTAQSFRPSVVPLPLFQGYVQKGSPPNKFTNAELMKIPNFLHLTPPAIDAHCEALKRFCTPWPKALKTDSDCKKHFPLESVSLDLIYTGPSLRNSRARVVTVNFSLADLKLDYRSRDKFLRLVGDRYNPKTDIVSIEADRCPMKKQNYDYLIYVITALYHESKKVEEWEGEKTEDDMEAYFYENSRSQAKIRKSLKAIRGLSDEEVNNHQDVQSYGKILEQLVNEGENEETLEAYKKNVLNILGLEQNLEFRPSEQ